LLHERGKLSIGLLNRGVAVSVGLEQLPLDLENPSRFNARDEFEAPVLNRGASSANAGLALLVSRFEVALGGFEAGLSFGDGGGAVRFELLLRMFMLPLQPGKLPLVFLIRLAALGGVGFEALPNSVQQIQGLFRIQNVIHNPS
jgi:hypothetical protein